MINTKELIIVLPFQITGMVPKITALQEALPKSIGLLSFDGGIAGNHAISFVLASAYVTNPLSLRHYHLFVKLPP
jgi:hypothetical protein